MWTNISINPDNAKIAEILSKVNRAIEQIEALIITQQNIKTGLVQDLLTCGIDEHLPKAIESVISFIERHTRQAGPCRSALTQMLKK